jgi:ATP-dependent RNA helicase SUPV3L1/SUV3
VEDECATRITELLPDAITLSASGRCTDCGDPIAPWFSTCRDCSARTAHRHAPSDTRPRDDHRRHPRQASGAGRPSGSDTGRHSRTTGSGTGRTAGGRRGRPSRPR